MGISIKMGHQWQLLMLLELQRSHGVTSEMQLYKISEVLLSEDETTRIRSIILCLHEDLM